MEQSNEIIGDSRLRGSIAGLVKEFGKREMTNGISRDNKMQKVISEGLRERMQELRQDVLEKLNDRMNDMVSEILQKVDGVSSTNTEDPVDLDEYADKIKSSSDILPTKQFVERNSLLTDLFEIKHIRSVYNIFMTILIILFINTAMHDFASTGSLNCGMVTIMRAFGKLSTVLRIWLIMKVSTLGVYVAFSVWANRHIKFHPKSVARKTWDYSWLAALILYDVAFFVFPTKMLIVENLPIASSMIILMEQIRMAMKTHAFVRSTAPRFLSYKPHSDNALPKIPNIRHYAYFLFAPTLVYQDTYPRTKTTRWRRVMGNFGEVMMVIFCLAFTYERCLLSAFERFGTEPIGWRMMIFYIFGSAFPGILFMLCGFYCLLHAWMNAFAEIMRFADKLFYKDWWNCTSYSRYYRTWNVVVHDWLYTYIYKDMYEIITPQRKTLSMFTVFMISAIFHEYILTFAFRFFYPVMFIVFGGPGVIVALFAKRAGNIFLWFSLSFGSGVMLSLYSMEYFARLNCPPYRDDFLDFLIPRTWLYLLNFTK